MTRYLSQPRDQMFVKGYGFLSFAKNMSRIIGKNISKNLNSKFNERLLDHTKQLATDALKTVSKRAIQKTAKATGDLIGNKTADKITKLSRGSPQNNSETVESETEKIALDREIPKERYTSPEKRQRIIDK